MTTEPHEPLDRDTLIDMVAVAEIFLLKGRHETLARHLALIRESLEVDLGVAQLTYAREVEQVSEAYLCQ